MEGTVFKKVALGVGHTAAIDDEGNIWTWGYNGEGQLGVNAMNGSLIPIKIKDGNFTDIFACGSQNAAIDTDKNLWAWGVNYSGQLGDGTTKNSASLIKIKDGTAFTTVSTGLAYTMAIDADGTFWAWGINDYGQLGYNPYGVRKIGDANGDGNIDSEDIICVKKHVVMVSCLSGESLNAADANRDGKVDAGDIFAIKKHIVMIEPIVPLPPM